MDAMVIVTWTGISLSYELGGVRFRRGAPMGPYRETSRLASLAKATGGFEVTVISLPEPPALEPEALAEPPEVRAPEIREILLPVAPPSAPAPEAPPPAKPETPVGATFSLAPAAPSPVNAPPVQARGPGRPRRRG